MAKPEVKSLEGSQHWVRRAAGAFESEWVKARVALGLQAHHAAPALVALTLALAAAGWLLQERTFAPYGASTDIHHYLHEGSSGVAAPSESPRALLRWLLGAAPLLLFAVGVGWAAHQRGRRR